MILRIRDFQWDFTLFLVHTTVKFEKSFLDFFCTFFVLPTRDCARAHTRTHTHQRSDEGGENLINNNRHDHHDHERCRKEAEKEIFLSHRRSFPKSLFFTFIPHFEIFPKIFFSRSTTIVGELVHRSIRLADERDSALVISWSFLSFLPDISNIERSFSISTWDKKRRAGTQVKCVQIILQ